jgi:hypothetical protein
VRRHTAAAVVLGCDHPGFLPGATTRRLLRRAECGLAFAPPRYEGPRGGALTIAVASAGPGPAHDLALRLRRTHPSSVILSAPETGEDQANRSISWRGRRRTFRGVDLEQAQTEPDLMVAAITRRHRSMIWVPGIPGSQWLRRRRFPLVLFRS